jgi:hypothetical protein
MPGYSDDDPWSRKPAATVVSWSGEPDAPSRPDGIEDLSRPGEVEDLGRPDEIEDLSRPDEPDALSPAR